MSSEQIISGGILGGVLTCTNMSISTAASYHVIPQARVDLVRGEGSLAGVIQSAVINTAGVYSFAIMTVDTVLNDPGSCHLIATVPSASCNLNVPTAVLRIPIVVLRVVDALVGKLLVRVPGALSNVVGI